MNENHKHLINALKLFAAGINEIFKSYHATVDVSGDVPQLNIQKR